jgi:hypothetical protein
MSDALTSRQPAATDHVDLLSNTGHASQWGAIFPSYLEIFKIFARRARVNRHRFELSLALGAPAPFPSLRGFVAIV